MLALAGVVVSLLLSAWTLSIDGIINNDGVHYILTAEYIAAGEWSLALEVFKWPAYSYLIYLVQHVPGVDFEAAAYAVTTVGFTLATLAFVSVVHALGGRGRVLYLAMAVVLAYPGINEFRAYLVRDALFLALYLFGLAAMLRYLASRRPVCLLRAVCLLFLAALFRVEALMIALLMPLLSISRGGGRCRRTVLAGYTLLVVPALALFYGWWIFRPENGEAAWVGMSEPWSVFGLALEQVSAELLTHLERAGYGDGLPGMLSAIAAVAWLVIRESVEALSLPYALVLAGEALRGRAFERFSRDQKWLIGWLVVFHVVALFAFAMVKFFLAPRYPVAMAITLVLAVPFIFDRYLRSVAGLAPLRRRLAILGVSTLLLVNTVEGVDNFTDKAYLRDAGRWLRAHAPADYRLAANDLKFVFYADRYGEKWVAFREEDEFREFLLTEQWKWKDYVAVNVRRKDVGLEDLLERTLAQPPVRRFDSENGDQLLIFYTGDD